MPRPMPRVPPVTSATLSGMAKSVILLGSLFMFKKQWPRLVMFHDASARVQEGSEQAEASQHLKTFESCS